MLVKFVKRNSLTITLLALLMTSFMLMSLDVKKRGNLNKLEELLIDSAMISQRGAEYSFYSIKELWLGYVNLIGVRNENLRLKKEAGELREKLTLMTETIQENKRLRELLKFKESTGHAAITARVIGMDPTNLFKTITIGKGSADGLSKGMAVATSDGVVGRIISSSADSSRVLLITDRNSDTDAVIQRSRDRGIAGGGDYGTLRLKYLPRSADAMEGDLLVTSGVGGIFPKGLAIGFISKLDRSAGGIFLLAEVRPVVNFSKLEEVLVITTSPKPL